MQGVRQWEGHMVIRTIAKMKDGCPKFSALKRDFEGGCQRV